MAPTDFDGLGKWTEAEIDNLLQVVAPQIFEPSAASDDSKKEPKFTTDKSSKDQLSEGKAVRDLLFRLELVKEWVSKILQDIRLYHPMFLPHF